MAWLPTAAVGQQPPLQVEAVAEQRSAPVVDGDLADWTGQAACRIDRADQAIDGLPGWAGPADAGLEVRVAYDNNSLFLAGVVQDDVHIGDRAGASGSDTIELFLGLGGEDEPGGLRAEDLRLSLAPLSASRPWLVLDPKSQLPRTGGSSLTGIEVAARRTAPGAWQFEAAVPFHHLANVRPGLPALGFALVLVDVDADGGEATRLSWGGTDPLTNGLLPRLRLAGAGPLRSSLPARLLPDDLLAGLRSLLLPLLAIVAMVVLTRLWRRWHRRVRWLRPLLLCCGVLLFGLGLLLPAWWLDWRDGRQQRALGDAAVVARDLVQKLERGTLASYRGAARDRALMELLRGDKIARQRYTSYRFLSQFSGVEFGARVREYPDEGFPVRAYWLPLESGRDETFQFDPPLQGEELWLVVGRPYGSFAFAPRAEPQRLQVEINQGAEPAATHMLGFDTFVDGSGLGREFHEVDWRRLPLTAPVRTLSLRRQGGDDLRIVGMSLRRAPDEPLEPLFLGSASLAGVQTDLRGPYPEDAGVELGSGARQRVDLPAGLEPFQRLWLFYRAVYPGLPTANPGATVAEVVLHFRGGAPPRTLQLEHQVSVFYELMVHNTCDEPPQGSPAAIAFSWIDEQKERHINTVLPVELPAGVELEAIEFQNRADYRLRFRSVVFGSEKAAAPPDPEDSPLERQGQDRRLRADVLAALSGVTISVWRAGRISESSQEPQRRQDLQSQPREVAQFEDAAQPLLTATPGGQRASVFGKLGGDGWDGAVMSVSVTDPGRDEAAAVGSRLGLGACLLGVPLLLVLLSELLAAVTNLRTRLMAVLSVAALAPLAVLSLVLAQVLERGHQQDQEAGMTRQVENALVQLDGQMQQLRGSAQQWLEDLAALHAQRHVKAAAPAATTMSPAPAALPALQQLLAGQLPPEWGGGFLRLEWTPQGDATTGAFTVVAGDERLATTDAPARREPGVYVHWGRVVIAVRAEAEALGGTLSLTVARPLGAGFLSALAPDASVLLCDARGYPLEVAGDRLDAKALLAHGRDAATMAQRERVLFQTVRDHQPAVDRPTSALGDWLCGTAVLRDLQETPRALLVLAQPDLPAVIELAIGRIPVRAFFLSVIGLLFVFAAFLSFVVSHRISSPIDALERGTQALARGELGARVDEAEGGQLGRLSRTFNKMATDLQERVFDLQELNRAMRELSAHLDSNHAVAVLRKFCEQHGGSDLVRVALLDPESGQFDLFAGAEPERCDASELAFLPACQGAFCLRCPADRPPAVLQRLPGMRSVLGVPMLVGGRCRGAVLLGFQTALPRAVDLELVTTVVAQAAVALENAQLYRHAVQDPVTGAFAPDYFRRRVAEEVALAQQRGQPLVLAGLGLGDGASRPRGLRRFAVVLREQLPRGGCLCHGGAGQFHLLLPGLDRAGGEALVLRILEAWQRVVARAPESDIEDKQPTTAVATFPEEAASAEFLFEALRDRLASGSALAPAAVEADASLQRAGITASSPVMREVYRTLRRVAPTDLAVLFLGETGAGKEVLTNLLHRWSRRSAGPLVKVHCAALSESLLQSELFGHEKGAFTGADRRKVGKFEQANGGTIFLDEVGEIPLDVQVQLLRVLQEREVDRVGGIEPVPVDVRVVAATNRDLERMVKDGRFREDLYYRLQGIVVSVPPLRERRPEIPALVEQFRSEVVAAGESRVRGFSTDAMDELFRREWPGNIRELRNAVHRAMVLASGEIIERRDVLAALPPLPASAAPTGSGLAAPPVLSGAAIAAPGVSAPIDAGPVLPAIGLPAPASAVEPVAPSALPPETPAEPTVVVPRPDPAHQLANLPDRARRLLGRIAAAGSIGTQEHMHAAGVSHRTGLRDLQLLLRLGLVVRTGSRRGARYWPSGQARAGGEKGAADDFATGAPPKSSGSASD